MELRGWPSLALSNFCRLLFGFTSQFLGNSPKLFFLTGLLTQIGIFRMDEGAGFLVCRFGGDLAIAVPHSPTHPPTHVPTEPTLCHDAHVWSEKQN
jgi:hypothetical protein